MPRRGQFWRSMRREYAVILGIIIASFFLACFFLSFLFGSGAIGYGIALCVAFIFAILGAGILFFSTEIVSCTEKIRLEDQKAKD